MLRHFPQNLVHSGVNPEALIRWLEQNGYDAECVKYKEPEVSKTGIGKLIKEGVPVPYASIEQGRSVGVK